MVKEVAERFGSIDILLNNAASKSRDLDAFFAPFDKYSLAQWREIMSVNIDGMFLVAQAVGARMAETGRGGSIIQTSSIYGIMAPTRGSTKDPFI
jgi:NAD(P)-dependent dehydrogenase (short-subunit alcohol dehydrogenase family)